MDMSATVYVGDDKIEVEEVSDFFSIQFGRLWVMLEYKQAYALLRDLDHVLTGHEHDKEAS